MTIHSAGQLLGTRYEIVEFVGEGGMQEVYEAKDQVLDKSVALKVPKTKSAQRRFRDSAVLSAKVNHPNAAKTLDYFEDGDLPYLIEEFIVGENLSQAKDQLEAMDPYLVAHILHHMARGVAASHHVGVVHRDLKPSNIMVAPDLSFGFLKITDFGIAKMAAEEIAEASEGGDESRTGSATLIGALPYMSPEMISTPRKTGTAADVWAMASIAYELLTGKKPFGKGLAAVQVITSGKVPALPARIATHSQFGGLGQELYALIKDCWTFDPKARPTADDVVTRCGTLCYPGVEGRVIGIVDNVMHNSWIFVEVSGTGEMFCHVESVFGPRPKAGDRVYLIGYPGVPKPRAHPLVRLKDPVQKP